MYNKFLFVVIVLLLSLSCTYDSLDMSGENAGLIIKTGTVCGWCTKNDILTITGNSVRYVNYSNCSTGSPTVSRNGTLNDAELDALLASLKFTELQKLDLNSCNVCVDGCDDWILVLNGTESHYIRYGRSDSELQPIMAFVDQISLIKAKYTSGN